MSAASESAFRTRTAYHAGLLGGFSMLAAAFLVMGNIATREAIEQRRAEDLLALLSQVVPAGIHDNDLLVDPITITEDDNAKVIIYRALQGTQVTGIAYEIVGQGYGGEIVLILAMDREGAILGTRVLSHAETPGLGDKIEASRSDWILDFNGRSLTNPPLERWGVKKDGGAFDQFTGATITPRSVVRAIKEGLELFRDHRETLLVSSVVHQAAVPNTGKQQMPEGKP